MSEVLPGEDFIERLKVLIDDAGSAEKLAKLSGVSSRNISKYLSGTDPSRTRLIKLAKGSGVNLSWLAAGEGPKDVGSVIPLVPENSSHYASDSLGNEYVLVPRFKVSASAGGGAIVQSEQIVDHLAFKADWVRNALDVPAKDLSLISVKGDSMEPTLSNGDLILIDTGTSKVEDNAIYVLRYNGTLLVKRVQRMVADGSIIIKSDNQAYDPEVIMGSAIEDLHVVGRVVWCGRRM